MVNVYNILQLCGGIILSIGYIPQIMQICVTKSVGDINLTTFVMVLLGILFMEIYAFDLTFHKKQGHMFFVTNSMALALNIIIVLLLIIYR